MAGLLEARLATHTGLAAALARRVREMAEAAGKIAVRDRHGSRADWRDAQALWPDFTRGDD